MRPKLGILAGGGQLPPRLIESCEAKADPYFIIAFEGQTPQNVVVGRPHAWVRLGAVGKAIHLLRENRVQDIVFAGSINRPGLRQLRPDRWAVRFLAKTRAYSKGDDGLLSALAGALESEEGFNIVGVHEILADILAPVGFVVSASGCIAGYHDDIRTAVSAALDLGRQDKGQAAVACQHDIIDLEDRRGTDALLARVAARRKASPETRSGVLAKVAKPGQEVRMDLPTIGPDTIRLCAQAGLAGIVVESRRSLIIEQESVRELAESTGVFVIAVDLSDGVDNIQFPN